MIDRSYLPFESARHYQDRKMQKWMGFFLSEHTSALSEDMHKVTFLSDLTLEQKLLLLSQVYANQFKTRLTVFDGKKSKHSLDLSHQSQGRVSSSKQPRGILRYL